MEGKKAARDVVILRGLRYRNLKTARGTTRTFAGTNSPTSSSGGNYARMSCKVVCRAVNASGDGEDMCT